MVIPLDLFNRLPAIAPYESTIVALLNVTGTPPSVLQELKVADAQMRQIEGKKVAMPDGSTMQPKAYPIYSDGSWHFDASSSACGKSIDLTRNAAMSQRPLPARSGKHGQAILYRA